MRASETIQLGAVGDQAFEVVSGLAVPAGAFVVKVRLAGKGFTRSFEKPFGKYQRVDRPVAGVFDTGYSIRPPAKRKALARPAKIAKLPHEGTAVLEVQGQFAPAWRLGEALQRLGKHSLKPAHHAFNVYGDQVDFFAPGYKEIMALDAVVLNNVPAEALGPEGLALLRDYVRHGGGLLVLGGWFAYGGGHYAESPLAEMLPVRCGRPFDIRWHKSGLALRAAPGAAWLAGTRLAEKPQALWLHELPGIKPGARVAMMAGDRPFLVAGTYGQGRVACILGTPMGVSAGGGKAFFECSEWPALLGRVIRWLKGAP